VFELLPESNIGVNWSTLTQYGDFTFGLLTDNPLAILSNSAFFGSHTRTFSDGTSTANVLFDALEREGLLTVLAEPNLTAISGETATFLAGGEFPVPVEEEEGGITVEFRQFGVSLAFTPTLVGENRISLADVPKQNRHRWDSSSSCVQVGGGSQPPHH